MVSHVGFVHGMLMAVWFWAPFAVTISSSPTPKAPLWVSRYPQNASTSISLTVPEPIVYGESPTSRTIYTVVSLVCISLLAGMLGHRTRQLERNPLKLLNFTRVLVLILNFLALSFVTSAAVVESGLGLYKASVCHYAIVICLAFYVSSKMTMYTFLVERAHAMRAPYMQRTRDWIWLVGMLSIAGGFGSIAICGFLWPLADISANDGRCRIGLPLKVTLPLLSFDVIINMALTAIFIYLLRPLLRFGGMSNSVVESSALTKGLRRILRSSRRRRSAEMYPMNRNFLKSIEALLWKSFIGSILVMIPTVGNLAALYSLQGRELGWLCLTICTFDVTWSVCVVHWLTVGSMEVDERALALLAQGDAASNASTGLVPSL